jgi:hypothetical protein
VAGFFRLETSRASRCLSPSTRFNAGSKTPSIATVRGGLQSLSWFMKCLKEPLSRLANRQDKTRGTFFESRFKSVAILDEEALLAISVYIYAVRLCRQGKASISAELAGIFERLNSNAQSWHKRMEWLGGDRLLGRFFACTRAKLREIGERLGVRHLANLTGCPLR